jgi:hypothetical protein
VIDFDININGVWLVIKNISAAPIVTLTVNFSTPIYGVYDRIKPNERTTVSAFDVFTKCQYLAPGKELRTFVESDLMFFKINPSTVSIAINCQDSEGAKYSLLSITILTFTNKSSTLQPDKFFLCQIIYRSQISTL